VFKPTTILETKNIWQSGTAVHDYSIRWSLKLGKNMFRIIVFLIFVTGIWNSDAAIASDAAKEINNIYMEIGLEEKLDWEIFRLTMIGFDCLEREEKLPNKSIITIIDFSKPSTEQRLFVLDLENKKILHSSLVSHGKNSGWNIANEFSNKSGSLMSSLGFFLTSETYYGKHGYSLRLIGLEFPFNDKAKERAIVIHKARYVSEEFIKKYGRLGRSWGCPALPVKSARTIIDEIKSGTCLFIYAKNEDYLKNSVVLNQKSDIAEK
jgi:hypothetical protein